MRKILQKILSKPLTWIGNYLAASPNQTMVSKSLSALYNSGADITSNNCIIIETDVADAKFIIFSDQHKGNKTWADDFAIAEHNYIAALQFYNQEQYHYVNLGDSEELWKFKPQDILSVNLASFAAEAAFHPNRFFKTFGNHDIIWKNALDVGLLLKPYFTQPLPIYEGLILRLKMEDVPLDVLLTHGHQGDLLSDNNRVSTWIVAHLWMPLQRYLRLNINAPSKDFSLRNKHNQMMHAWSSQQRNLVLITGHTHSPVFASGKYFNHPGNAVTPDSARQQLRPVYFNTGCCCFSDGDITGIEIADGYIRLVKWAGDKNGSTRIVLEEIPLKQLISDLQERH